MLNIIRYRWIWLTLSGVLVTVSLALFASVGLRLSIDFTGGSLLEARYTPAPPATAEIQEALRALQIESIVQPTGETGVIVRTPVLDEPNHQKVLAALEEQAQGQGRSVEQIRFESVGPSVGEKLSRDSFKAIVIVLIGIILFIAFAFRKSSRPVASWKYGVVTTIALFHDIIIVVGIFVLLGLLMGVQVDVPFVAALLTVLGYSVNDTIIIFDRIRENLNRSSEEFAALVNRSLNETLRRSINTGMTTELALTAVFFFGGETTKMFALALIIGILLGTYSSIFVASPLIVLWEAHQRKARSGKK